MGKKKLKDELKDKILKQLTAVVAEANPEIGEKIKKSVDSSAKYLSGKIIKTIKKLEKKKLKAAKGEKKPKAAKKATKPAAPKPADAPKVEAAPKAKK